MMTPLNRILTLCAAGWGACGALPLVSFAQTASADLPPPPPAAMRPSPASGLPVVPPPAGAEDPQATPAGVATPAPAVTPAPPASPVGVTPPPSSPPRPSLPLRQTRTSLPAPAPAPTAGVPPGNAPAVLQPGETAIAPPSEGDTAGPDEKIDINFPGSPLSQVLSWYSKKTNRTMILSPGIDATITLFSQGPLSRDDALRAVEAALAMNNISLVPYGDKFFRVVQSAAAIPDGVAIRTEEADAQRMGDSDALASQVVSLKHLTLDEVTPILQGLLHAYGKVQALERTNSLLITDTQNNLKRVLQVLEYLDKPSALRSEVLVRELKYAEAGSVAQQITTLISESQSSTPRPMRPTSPSQPVTAPAGVIRAPTSPAGRTSASMDVSAADRGVVTGQVKVLSDERTNTLIIITDPSNKVFFDQVIDVLDREVEPEMVVRVHPLEYADAEEAASMLNDFIGAANTARRTTPGATGTRGESTTASRATSASSSAADARSQSIREFIDRIERPASGTPESGATKFGQISPNTRILADIRSNSLLLMGRKGDVDALLEVTRQIDVMLAQVIIEAVIIEVTLSDNISYGFDWLQRSFSAYQNQTTGPRGGVTSSAPIASWGGGLVTGESSSFKDAATVARDTVLSGGQLTYFLTLNNLNIDGVLRLAASSSDAQVLSTPVIMTTDNTEATIIAGEERPVVGNTTVTDGGNTSSSYEYRSIGIELAVKPRINPARVVVMEVKQKADNVGDTVVIDGNEVPVITKREMQALLTVSNRTTVVLGGLVSNTDRKVQTKVPFLGDIPLIGRLFRSQSTQKQRTELLVFLTPYVITTPHEARDETRRLHDSINARDTQWHTIWNDGNLGRENRDKDARGIPLRSRTRRTAAPVPPSTPSLLDAPPPSAPEPSGDPEKPAGATPENL